jgi:hypothetical protein
MRRASPKSSAVSVPEASNLGRQFQDTLRNIMVCARTGVAGVVGDLIPCLEKLTSAHQMSRPQPRMSGVGSSPDLRT